MVAQPKVLYEFGPFRVDPDKQLLLRGDQSIPITPKAFETLLILIRNCREIVSKDELMKRVWPDAFVEENNLSQNIFILRRALGDTPEDRRYIVTLPGRGYRFVSEVRVVSQVEKQVAFQPGAGSHASGEQPDGSAPETASLNESSGKGALLPRSTPGSDIHSFAAGRRWAGPAITAAVVAVLTGASFFGYRFFRHRSQEQNRTDAAQEYQVGRELWRQRHADSIVKAIKHYQRAIEIDPAYAPAYSGLADAYLALPLYSSIPKSVLFPKALEAARKAVNVDPMLAEAHISLADAKSYSEDLVGADPEYRRGIELDPNYATGHQWYANYLSLMGRHREAIEQILRAQELEPLSLVMYHNAGQIYYNAREYDLAIVQFNKALQIDPGFYPACIRLADALRQQGMYREALQTELDFHKHHGSSINDVGADQASAERLLTEFENGGKEGYWRTRLQIQKAWTRADQNEGLTSNDGTPIYALAIDYAQNGEKDTALALLNKVVDQHGWDMYHLKTEPDLDPLRSDPRFQSLLLRVGFP